MTMVELNSDRVETEAIARKALLHRTRLLNEELDRLDGNSTARSSSVGNKASFLAVTAGVVVTAAASLDLGESQIEEWKVLLPFVLSGMGLLCAVLALRPTKLIGIDARRIVDKYLDSAIAPSELEQILVSSKAEVIANREVDIIARARLVSVGLVFLVASICALAVLVSAHIGN